MKLINADDLKKHAQKLLVGESINTYFGVNLYKMFEEIIDNTPTVEAIPLEVHEKAMDIAVDDLFKVQEELNRIRNEKRQGEWIPVSEGLPNTLGVYNVTRKLKEGETIYFISDASYFDGQNTWHRDTGINHGRPYLTDVIAWMPRPEPYKKEGAE